MKNIDNIPLKEVQKTLVLPLAARAFESEKPNGILHDPQSVKIAKEIPIDYKKISRTMTELGVLGLVIRALEMDKIIKEFQVAHPYGKILTLGAGLDTSFFRADNGKTEWYDLDLPESMNLRKQYIPNSDPRVHYISKSMFDLTWIDDIGNIDNGLLILIPGVLPYFEEEQVKHLLSSIAPQLPNAQVAFDIISQLGILMVHSRIKETGIKDAPLRWGIIETSTFEEWSDHIEVIESIPFFSSFKTHPEINWLYKILMNINDFLSMSQLVKIRFKS